MLDNKAKLGQVWSRSWQVTNEVEADKLLTVFEVFKFDSQVGFL